MFADQSVAFLRSPQNGSRKNKLMEIIDGNNKKNDY